MNLKNELEKSIPAKIILSEKEKNRIRNHVLHPPKPRFHLKPIFLSIFSIMIAVVLFLPSIQSALKEENPSSLGSIISDDTDSSNSITKEQKLQYHKQYIKIVEEAMEKKLGLSLSVPPIEEFKEEEWKTPEEYEIMIQNIIVEHLKREREKIAAMSSYLKPAVTNMNGETTKSTYVYFSDFLREIEVTAKFDKQYSAVLDRQIFVTVDNVSSKLASSRGKWEQTSYEASLVDDGQKYRIQIEGVFELNNISFEKEFIIEFNCDEFGNII